MSAYLLVIFFHLPSGDISARSHPQLFMGADKCLSVMVETKKQVLASGAKEKDFTLQCVDSKLFPGNPT